MKTRIFANKEDGILLKEYGVKYDGRMKSFYVPSGKVISLFNSFIPLTVELVPASNWESNVRSEYKHKWDDIRRYIYKRAGYKCEICGGVGEAHTVECHEIWSYDIDTKIQKLEGLISLCPICHKTKHYGFAVINGQEKIVRNHIKKINKWKEEDVDKYIEEAFIIFEHRSKFNWNLDMSYLKTLKV